MSFYQPGQGGGYNPPYPPNVGGPPKPPTSFGQPHQGFQRPPASFGGMPQPHGASLSYPNYPPNQSSSMPPYPGSNQGSAPYPGGSHPGSAPYPGGANPAPYPSGNAAFPNPGSGYPPSSAPYPSGGGVPNQNPAPYPMMSGSNPAPYPSVGNNAPYPPMGPNPGSSAPYPGANQSSAPYPGSNHGSAPYPGPNQTPYPGSNPSPAPYPGSNPGSAPYPGSNHGSTPYPSSNPGSAPYPGSNQGSAPYPGGSNRGPAPYPSSNPPYGGGGSGGSMYPSLSQQKSYQPQGSGRYRKHNKKPSPTVVPADGFNARSDAEILRKAMKGFGTDEKSIIQVLANRSNAQRLEIAFEFKTLYGKDLIKDLKSELSGKFEDLVVALMTPLPQYIAKQLEKAMRGLGTDEETLIEVLCTMTNDEIATIREAYEAMYNKSLEDSLIGETSGNFRRLMVSLVNANRDESGQVDPDAAMQDAQQLLQAGELKYFGTDESTFNMILCQRNYDQLRLVFDTYRNIVGHDIEEAIKNEFSGDIKDGLLAIVGSVRDKATFFAKRLHQSMKGLGTNDDQLIRIVVIRSEVDMGDIKEAFAQKYSETLGDCISGDCSGHYKKCLLALIKA